jgi:hypothetical protein
MYPHISNTIATSSRSNCFGYKKTNWLSRFIGRFNPANWFNELSQIDISMEELSWSVSSREEAALRDCQAADPIAIG